MNFLTRILSMLPLFIHGAESMHGPSSGPDKKSMVINSIFTLAGELIPPATQTAVAENLGKAIDATVAVLNAAGALPKPLTGA